MINLFDTYNTMARDLHFSMLVAELKHPTVVLQDDGFLPNDVTSPLQQVYQQAGVKLVGEPRYFNQIDMPKFWELEANGNEGWLMDKGRRRGKINYAATDNNRLVRSVEWYDLDGKTKVVEHYNRWGFKYAVTTYSRAGQPNVTTYLTPGAKPVLEEVHATGQLTYYRPDGKVVAYPNWVALTADLLKASDYDLSTVNFNSLGSPLFVIQALGDRVKFSRLFWQEPLNGSVPGNMDFMLNGGLGRCEVVVQDRQVARELLGLVTDPNKRRMIKYLGFAYPFHRLNQERKEILICTNSDQLVGIEELIQQLPDFHFRIAAVTEMSSRLMSLDHYANVNLYPTVKTAKVKELFAGADIYLDINRGNEILNAVRAAFENNMLIVAMEETMHQPRYVATTHRFTPEGIGRAADLLKRVMAPDGNLEGELQAQWQAANRALPKEYKALFSE